MILSKIQSKQLRYLCGICNIGKTVRTYTNTPDGKLRSIGIFRYTETPGELISFSRYNGKDFVPFDMATATVDDLFAFVKEPVDVSPPKPSESIPDLSDAVAPEKAPDMSYEEALREVSMNAAALEALRLCGIESTLRTAVAIVKEQAHNPTFLQQYWECLEKVGTPRTLDAVIAALPAQQEMLRMAVLPECPEDA